ncbi:MAG: hypothetical protein FWC67_03810, partial [Defluviitaleaceae bacterium]|nr:hypothetical protein [Defluviitaleaceae bacterium]
MSQFVRKYEEIFNVYQISIDDHLEALRDRGILKYRTKFIKSGDFLEIDIYPIWRRGRRGRSGAQQMPKPSRVAQERLNHRNRARRVARLLHCNFAKGDLWATLTYDDAHLPADDAAAQRDIQNYIRRLRAFGKKQGGAQELKYIYVTERGKGRVHHHIIMNFADREAAERLWGKGARGQTRRIAPDDFGLEGLANYITKEKGQKHSK